MYLMKYGYMDTPHPHSKTANLLSQVNKKKKIIIIILVRIFEIYEIFLKFPFPFNIRRALV